MSDFFSHDAGRTTRKVTQAPGGNSSISFGAPPASPAKSAPAPAAPAPVAETAPEPTFSESQPAKSEKMDPLEEVKLKVGRQDLATFGQTPTS